MESIFVTCNTTRFLSRGSHSIQTPLALGTVLSMRLVGTLGNAVGRLKAVFPCFSLVRHAVGMADDTPRGISLRIYAERAFVHVCMLEHPVHSEHLSKVLAVAYHEKYTLFSACKPLLKAIYSAAQIFQVFRGLPLHERVELLKGRYIRI